ncbi:hypothetical protein H7S4_003427 [Paenibacillus dendritiformis]|nr:hypothetical protein [Paenibacillus dendritiformis]CAH8770692.1 hypothetical protein H7S4_003427 [Paenibacillus dendritiformis]
MKIIFGWFTSTYGGKAYEESGANPWDLTDEQIKFLTEDHVRHILVTSVESPVTSARWSNAVQAFAEGTGLGIPANNSSDPPTAPITALNSMTGQGAPSRSGPACPHPVPDADRPYKKRYCQIERNWLLLTHIHSRPIKLKPFNF